MPGIENTAPERTLTSSGFSGSPSRRPVRSSSAASRSSTPSQRPSGQAPSARMASTQASVVTVKPSGTGTPMRCISATLAPLPPSRLRISADPSDWS